LSKIVLGVQDDATTVDSLARLFKQSCPSVQFFLTGSGEEALAFLQDAAWAGLTPELILVDMHSLGTRGLEALAALRTSDSFWRIPVVMLMAVPLPAKETNHCSMGVTRCIVAPHIPEGLMNTVRSICAFLWPVFTSSKRRRLGQSVVLVR
jgi:CheY-like chemotaxis protein